MYHEEDEDNGQKDKEEDQDISMTSTRWYTSHVSSFHLRGMLGLFGVFDVFRVFGGVGGKRGTKSEDVAQQVITLHLLIIRRFCTCKSNVLRCPFFLDKNTFVGYFTPKDHWSRGFSILGNQEIQNVEITIRWEVSQRVIS